jgi:uncharacterized damage-inducible protein DinB
LHTSVERVHTVLSITAQRWQQLTGTLPNELLARPPAAGEWSALQCLQHLLDAELHLFPVRLRALLAGQNFSDFDPGQATAVPSSLAPVQLAAAFANIRGENLPLIREVTDEDLRRSTQHPRLGTVTLAELLQTWAAHDLMHTVQAERALMQPFMLNCGPWRPFFRDHEVAPPEEAV